MNGTKPEIQCRYLRTTSLFNAHTSLLLPNSTSIRFFDEFEAAKFLSTMRRRNAKVQLGGPRNFYVQRASELANRTVIEVHRAANPQEMLNTGENIALLVEKIATLSTTLYLRREDLLRKIGISTFVTSEVNFVVTSQFHNIYSRSQRAPAIDGIKLDKQFCNRFLNCGFVGLFQYCQTDGDLAKRVQASVNWLHESRREPRLTASAVKTSIALESLLIFSESESLARTLSERSAFILSQSPNLRHDISRIILRFYDVRSGIVHGSRRKAKKLTPTLIEGADRLVLLLHLIIASNSKLWPSVEGLRVWCEQQRWGEPASDVIYPFSQNYLKKALALVEVEMQTESS